MNFTGDFYKEMYVRQATQDVRHTFPRNFYLFIYLFVYLFIYSFIYLFLRGNELRPHLYI